MLKLNVKFRIQKVNKPMSERNRELVRRKSATMTSQALKQSTGFGASFSLRK